MSNLVKNVPPGVINADPRLFSDDCVPELVWCLMRELAREQGISHPEAVGR